MLPNTANGRNLRIYLWLITEEQPLTGVEDAPRALDTIKSKSLVCQGLITEKQPLTGVEDAPRVLDTIKSKSLVCQGQITEKPPLTGVCKRMF
jgi:hypothetical protein